jgi:hypothetical protein
MSDRAPLGRLLARLTGRWHLERLAALDEKVTKFGRAQRDELAEQRRQLADLRAALSTRAPADAVHDVRRAVQQLQASLAQQDRAFSEALERVRLLDAQGVDDRRFARRVERLVRDGRPILVGPWTGEVGFELLYWIPFVRWVVTTYGISPDRLRVVSRGGTAAWYGNLAARYSDVFEHVTPEAFRAATEAAKKQRQVGAFDAEVARRIVEAHGGPMDLLHPGMMYRLFQPYWKGAAPATRVERYTAYAPIARQRDDAVPDLPAEYVAVRFYFSDCFPDTEANRAFVASTIEALERQVPVVLLNTPFALDDHRDVAPAAGRVLTIGARMAPERNLALQTEVIAGARAFVGTYGGYSYLAPLCGVPSLAFYSARTFKMQHLEMAQRALAGLGAPALVPLDTAVAPLVRLALGSVAVAAR